MRLNPRPVAVWLARCAGTLMMSTLLVMGLCATALAHAGSVYVSVDSWVYPAVERLAALTGAREDQLGTRPWTRSQIARFLERAREMPHDAQAEKLQATLENEFDPELSQLPEPLALESLYTRSMQIAGEPMRDAYHLGETVPDDFGRPYGEGFNTIEGTSGYVQYRAAMLYFRGEYEHGASLRGPTSAGLASLASRDDVSTDQVLTQGSPTFNGSRLLDTYVGVSFSHWTATLGKQSLWWGPAAGGAMLYSNNIEPIWMGRLTNDVPYKIPILGLVRLDMFYGKLQGHRYLPRPWIHGEKVTLQPFKSFQIGFSRTDVFAGVGRGFTLDRLANSYFSLGNNQSSDLAANDPGDRRGGLDFSWKLPKVPATLYSDSFCDDNPSPLAAPNRSAFHPGLYIARLPGAASKFDLRLEGAFTASLGKSITPGYNYWNGVYRDGYTNRGQLIGDTVGRDGTMWQAWTTYWIAPRDKVQLSYRNEVVSPQFLPGGGTQNDVRATTNFVVKRNFEIALGMQWERAVMPVLYGNASANYNVSGWAGVTLWESRRPMD